MSTVAKIALRNLNRQKKRSFLLGGAIAFGIFIVTVINGIAGAFQANLAANIAQFNGGHIFVEGVEKNAKDKPYEIIRDEQTLMDAVAEAGFAYETVSRRSVASGTLLFAGKRATQAIFGVNFDKEPFLSDRIKLKEGSWDKIKDPGAVVLNEGIANKLKLQVGDRITFELNTVTGQKNFGELWLVGISQDAGLFSSQIAYAEQTYLNSLLDMGPEEFSLFSVMLKDMKKADADTVKLIKTLKTKAQVFELSLQDLLPSAQSGTSMSLDSRQMKYNKLAKSESWEGAKYRVMSINDTVSFIEDIVNVVNFISFIILLVLFLIIMVGISNTFRMIMFERIKEIGTMRALGMQQKQVKKLFLSEASFLSLGGTIAGWILAGIFMFCFSLINFGTDSVLSLFLKKGHFSFQFQLVSMLGHCALVLVLTVLAAHFPAKKAAKLPPAEALRTAK